ncbi:tyrosine-protein kinase Etk/Wzc [Paraburkholderia sp. GAS333]|uniref:polysaccharide biosynthesis tyrosine autokinase n=1 Tax=Paraburkholderia sp. GAS333 TaxID=3156279 RepID=UPI003D24DE44
MRNENQIPGKWRTRSDEITLTTLIETLLNHKTMIAVTTIVVFVLACGYVFFSPPVYESHILVKIDQSSDTPTEAQKDLLNYVSRPFNDKSSADREAQLLTSRSILWEAVDEDKLYIDARPRYFPIFGAAIARLNDDISTPGFLGLGGFVWGSESVVVGDFDVPEKFQGKRYMLRALAGGAYELLGPGLPDPVKGKVGALEHFQSHAGPITLRVTSLDGEPNAEFILQRQAEQLVVDELQKTVKVTEEGNKSGVLMAVLRGNDRHRVAQTIGKIGKQYLQWNVKLKSDNAKATLARLNEQLPAMKAQVNDAEAAYNSYRNEHGIIDISEESHLLARQLTDETTQMVTLRRAREQKMATFAPTSPDVVAIDQQIGTTQQAIDRLNEKIKAMPMTEQEALRRLRDLRISEELYSSMRTKVQEMQVLSAGTAGSVQLVDPAEVPIRPVKPTKLLVLAAALVGGLLLGAALAVARDRLFRGVTDTDEIESDTGLSVFATIPFSDKQTTIMRRAESGQPQQLPLAVCYPGDPVIESLRMFRTALQFAVVGARNNVVMLAGPLPGIGKSFLSANLATVLSAGGKRVLLIDGDLRKGRLEQHLGVKRGEGLADVLSGQRSMKDVLAKDVQRNLDFLQTGAYPPNPADLLMSERFRETVEQASEHYDLVLIDAPAILAVSDIGVMAPIAGSIFLVARFGDTLTGEIDASVKRLAQSGAKVNGILLNGVKVHITNYAMARRYGTQAYVQDYVSDRK